MVPVLMALLVFVLALGRFGLARAEVDGAARDAARAASIARDPGAAAGLAVSAAEATLAERDITCERLDVDTDTSAWAPGGTVAVEVTCEVTLADLTGIGLPGSRPFATRFVAPLDTYRATDP